MQISLNKPPIWDEISKLFGVKESDVIWYCYGDTIYAPCKKMPPDDYIVHEQVHAEQQGHSEEGAGLWWQSYIRDPEFRAQQEAEAYGEQLRWLKRQKAFRDRNKQARLLHGFAQNLSAPMYGGCVTHSEAMKMIRAYAEGTAVAGIEKHMPEAEI